MRPWLHIPAAIFAITLILTVWVSLREVPLDRQSASTGQDDPLATPPTEVAQDVLQGVLLRADGTLVAGADLSTQQDGRVLWAQSDAEGHFRLEGLQAGPLQVAILPPRGLPQILSVPGPELDARLVLELEAPEGATAKSPPELPEWSRSTWTARIKNPQRSDVLEGYQIWLVPTGPPDQLASGIPRRTTTDAKGEFQVPDLLHAPYGVHVLPPGNPPGLLRPNLLVPLGETPPVLNHGTQATPVEWVLQSGELFGRVQIEGRPVRAALVMLETLVSPDTESGQSQVLTPVQTDSNGEWSIPDLPPARYRVRVRGGGLTQEKVIDLGAQPTPTNPNPVITMQGQNQPIYLDNAATTPMGEEVRRAMGPFLEAEYGNPSARYGAGVRASEALAMARARVRSALCAENHRVVFTSGGTEANNLAVLGSARKRKQGVVWFGATEHASVRLPALALGDEGFQARALPLTQEGDLDLAAALDGISKDAVCVAHMLVNNEVGTLYDIPSFFAAVREKAPRAHLHVDCIQGLGKLDLDLLDLGADSLSVSGHKVHGPKGSGALIVRKDANLAPLILGGPQEDGLRSGTENVAGAVGLAVAVERAVQAQDAFHQSAAACRAVLESGLENMRGMVARKSPRSVDSIVSVEVPGAPGEVWQHHLEGLGFEVGVGSACQSKSGEISPALQGTRRSRQKRASSLAHIFLAPNYPGRSARPGRSPGHTPFELGGGPRLRDPDVLVVRYGELALKGGNRRNYERALERNLRKALAPLGEATVQSMHARILIHPSKRPMSMARRAAEVFGVKSVSPAYKVEDQVEPIVELAKQLVAHQRAVGSKKGPIPFRVRVKRADKRFPLESGELERLLAEAILPEHPELTVDLKGAELELGVEIRGRTNFVFLERLPGPGGLPVGTSGRGLCLLSGGIDSPVAAWLAMKRGLSMGYIGFDSPAYLGPGLAMKVRGLARRLTHFQGKAQLFLVPFSEIQEAIRDHTTEAYRVVLYRRMMNRIASIIADQAKYSVLVTGECLGQVASQTVQNMQLIGEVATPLMLRPLVTYDKEEAVDIARRIGTLDLSIESQPDCCTLFQPKAPVIHGDSQACLAAEEGLDIEGLVARAVEQVGLEVITPVAVHP